MKFGPTTLMKLGLIATVCTTLLLPASALAATACEPLKTRLEQATAMQAILRKNASKLREVHNDGFQRLKTYREVYLKRCQMGITTACEYVNQMKIAGIDVDALAAELNKIKRLLNEESVKLEEAVKDEQYVRRESENCARKEEARKEAERQQTAEREKAAAARQAADRQRAQQRAKSLARSRAQHARDVARAQNAAAQQAVQQAAQEAAAAAAIGAAIGIIGSTMSNPAGSRGAASPRCHRRPGTNFLDCSGN